MKDAAPPYQILVLNGPNLAFIGSRRPEIYGDRPLSDIPEMVSALLKEEKSRVNLIFFQSNSESGLIERLEKARKDAVHGIVLNAGAYTHTSLALGDCIEWIGIPVVEVHITNIFARAEKIRSRSFLAPHALGIISGFGLQSYALGVLALYAHLSGIAE
ncbi:MAG: 3-dehydroquinate dehydratase [Desulfovibrio sp.]|jgi:3-dehydroquinate dehydratase-2|nr:3-dehydroquinate dehydratase [Desulfovibrio sp.]